jgi:hypothetical protein
MVATSFTRTAWAIETLKNDSVRNAIMPTTVRRSQGLTDGRGAGAGVVCG